MITEIKSDIRRHRLANAVREVVQFHDWLDDKSLACRMIRDVDGAFDVIFDISSEESWRVQNVRFTYEEIDDHSNSWLAIAIAVRTLGTS